MKKAIKKLMAALLAVAMLCAMAVPAMAVKPDNFNVHTYRAYQIFSGTIGDDEGSASLGNIDWGTGVDGTALLNELKTDSATSSVFGSANTAKDVAKALSDYGADTAIPNAFARIAYKHIAGDLVTGTGSVKLSAAGYYLFVDTTDFSDSATDTVYNLALLNVAKAGQTITPEVKNSYPTVDKKVEDKNDSTGVTEWGTSADRDIGDSVNFTLTGTLPEDYGRYTSYYYQFSDSMDDGLTYNKDAKVYVVNGESETEITSSATIASTGDHSFTVTITDTKTISSITKESKIVVKYSATLNENAAIAGNGNHNKVKLTYSNNPNSDSKGNTPEKEVVVYTFKLLIHKVAGDNKSLSGAVFALYKKTNGSADKLVGIVGAKKNADDQYVMNGDKYVADGTTTDFVWTGLDDGDYILKEIVTPAGYNTAEDYSFTIIANHNDSAHGLENVTGTITLTKDSYSTLTGTVVNNTGATLPSTGGIGTTIFYIVGGGLMVAAAVLLITKKRMENK